ncbi:unnamed protein product [Pleuronectes platessa]|uniref:Uncharacterized protein n=1 Tax=Pleuronectes platessa TaxID=8262 RepID=A0A9N7Y7T9_PLEPL|nr:unnamed protein product [Pleuronectes platessa]
MAAGQRDVFTAETRRQKPCAGGVAPVSRMSKQRRANPTNRLPTAEHSLPLLGELSCVPPLIWHLLQMLGCLLKTAQRRMEVEEERRKEVSGNAHPSCLGGAVFRALISRSEAFDGSDQFTALSLSGDLRRPRTVQEEQEAADLCLTRVLEHTTAAPFIGGVRCQLGMYHIPWSEFETLIVPHGKLHLLLSGDDNTNTLKSTIGGGVRCWLSVALAHRSALIINGSSSVFNELPVASSSSSHTSLQRQSECGLMEQVLLC